MHIYNHASKGTSQILNKQGMLRPFVGLMLWMMFNCPLVYWRHWLQERIERKRWTYSRSSSWFCLFWGFQLLHSSNFIPSKVIHKPKKYENDSALKKGNQARRMIRRWNFVNNIMKVLAKCVLRGHVKRLVIYTSTIAFYNIQSP